MWQCGVQLKSASYQNTYDFLLSMSEWDVSKIGTILSVHCMVDNLYGEKVYGGQWVYLYYVVCSFVFAHIESSQSMHVYLHTLQRKFSLLCARDLCMIIKFCHEKYNDSGNCMMS